MSNLHPIIKLLFILMQVRAEEFFNIFFSDDSVNFHESFHAKCGDKGDCMKAFYGLLYPYSFLSFASGGLL